MNASCAGPATAARDLRPLWAGLLALGAAAGCSAATRLERDGGVDDAGPDGSSLPSVEAVDLLFVVDHGCAGPAFGLELERHAAVLVRALLEPEVDPETGEAPPPVRSLHAGMTSMSADMAGFQTANCFEVDDGRLLVERRESCVVEMASDCGRPPCPWVAHSDPDPGGAPAGENVACLLGRDRECGCGWHQPLEAALRALTVRSETGESNEGFLRDDSVLALIFLADGDDCSAGDPALFDMAHEDLGGFPARCALHPELLTPVAEYVDEIRSIRPSMGDRVVVGVFGGFPPEEQWRPGDPVDGLAAWVRPDPDYPALIESVCDWPGGIAWPSPRLVELAYAFGEDRYVLASICGTDWDSSPAMAAMARAILRAMTSS